MAVGASNLRSHVDVVSDAILENAPILIIEHPLESYYSLGSLELELGSKSFTGNKFSTRRLQHIKSIDAIFTDKEQVCVFVVLTTVILVVSISLTDCVSVSRPTIRQILTVHTIKLLVLTMLNIAKILSHLVKVSIAILKSPSFDGESISRV
jgi:hypothetical protein